MEPRYHMRNKTHMIEYPRNKDGLLKIKQFRRGNVNFKYAQIRPVLQVMPEDVEIGKVYKLT